MEFLVIVLFVVAIVVVNFVVSRAQRRKKQAGGVAGEGAAPDTTAPTQQAKPQRPARQRTFGGAAAAAGPRTSAEAAREANARLDSAQHQQVYAAIAQGHPVKAVKLYAQFTGVGIRAAGAAVENLATHPQPYRRPETGTPDAGGNTETGTPESGNAKSSGKAAGSAPATPDQGGIAGRPAAPGGASAEDRQDKQDRPDKQDKAGTEDAAPPAADPRRESTAKQPATPEEDEISKWVKDLWPEDF